jgi:hypothetical protein
MEETGEPGENHWPVASHWQTISHNIVSSTPRQLTTLVVIDTNFLSMTENRLKCDDSECEIQSVGFENMEQIMVSKTFSGAVVIVW